MQGKHLYEYAVIRLVPKVERESSLMWELFCSRKERNISRRFIR